MILDKAGNILEDDAVALINTVNTVGVMGKGIALEFKRAFPHNYEVYLNACKSGQLVTGRLLPVKDSSVLTGERLIINFPTKRNWRDPSQYEYVESGLIALHDFLQTHKIKSIAVPALGCGNGGLDWNIVRPMITEHLADLDTDIRVYQPQGFFKEQKPVFSIIVAGGRKFDDYRLLCEKLDRIIFDKRNEYRIEIVSGRAAGADTLGERYAIENNLMIKEFPADWSLDRSAGYLRDKEMAEYADACVCFWDGKSKGTKHMIDLAGEHDLNLRVIHYAKNEKLQQVRSSPKL